jgi:hypothetical protein
MKKILLFATSLISYSFTFSQVIEKNQKILGGTLSAGFNHSQADTTISSEPSIKGNNLYFNLSPSFGKAIKKNLVFGYNISISYSYSKSEDLHLKQTGKSNAYGVGAGMFIEKFFPITKSLSFSGTMPLQLNYGTSKNKSFENSILITTQTSKYYGAGLGVYPSLSYLLNKKIILQLSLNNFIWIGYTYRTSEIDGSNVIANKQSSSNFGFSTRVNQQTPLSDLGFAFRYIL